MLESIVIIIIIFRFNFAMNWGGISTIVTFARHELGIQIAAGHLTGKCPSCLKGTSPRPLQIGLPERMT